MDGEAMPAAHPHTCSLNASLAAADQHQGALVVIACHAEPFVEPSTASSTIQPHSVSVACRRALECPILSSA